MKILVAGSTGALGAPTVRGLVERGHEVYGLTRSESKAASIESAGARPVFGDVLDAQATERVISEVEPEGVIQLLNDIPKRGPMRPSELDSTNELRTTGTRHLVDAALRHGTRRYVVESMIFGYGYGDRGAEPLTEEAPFGEPVGNELMLPALDALTHMERMVLDPTERGELEGIVLRLGLFYGPGVGSTEFTISLLRKHLMFLPGGGKGRLSWIHVEDGARACVDALERAQPGSVFNVVDDRPASFADMTTALSSALGLPGPKSIPLAVAKPVSSYATAIANTNLPVANARIKRELQWAPLYPTIAEGVRSIADRRAPAGA